MPAARVHVIADFNAEPLARVLAHTALPGADVTTAPFGQVFQALAAPPPSPDCTVVVWTQPAAVVEAFRRAADFETVDVDAALDEVQAFASAVAAMADRVRHVFVTTWALPPAERGYGPIDLRPGGVGYLLMRMNGALADAFRDRANVFLLDAQRWIASVGARAVSPKLWYASKTPFAPAVFEHAAGDIAAALDGLGGRARRLVIVDLDNVLWGGIVGEVGWESLTLGGHDHVGEAFADFQRALKALTRRGVQIAVVSKNDEVAALEAIDRHPEMQLRRADLAGWRINWRDKAQNVVDLLGELNLGAESALFIDDSAIERGRVRDAVPGILVPDWPDDPARYREALRALRCFDSPFVTAEDRGRSAMYAAERERRATLAAASTLEDWLATLGITVTVEPLSAANLDRAAQLFNKTNQMNMATRRLSDAELEAWAADPRHRVLTFRVADRFGDYGLTALVGVDMSNGAARLTDYLLSCRVMGRQVEETMLHVAIDHARALGAGQLVAEFTPTARNAPCLEFLRRSGLRETRPHRFSWDTSDPYERPRFVSLQAAAAKP